jgi:hypothetical protein
MLPPATEMRLRLNWSLAFDMLILSTPHIVMLVLTGEILTRSLELDLVHPNFEVPSEMIISLQQALRIFIRHV